MTNKLSIVLLCIDYRFCTHVMPLIEEKYGAFDLIAVAGASKNLVSPMGMEENVTVLKNIELAVKFHQPEQLILTNHLDCAAYGGSKHFGSHDEEMAFHKDELKKAKAIAHEKFPHLAIKTLLVTKDDEGVVSLIDTENESFFETADQFQTAAA